MSLRAPMNMSRSLLNPATSGLPLLSAADGLQPASSDRRRLHSEQLFGQAQEVEIAHGDAVYRLRRTSLGKLILTK